jgi:hypothetical protein
MTSTPAGLDAPDGKARAQMEIPILASCLAASIDHVEDSDESEQRISQHDRQRLAKMSLSLALVLCCDRRRAECISVPMATAGSRKTAQLAVLRTDFQAFYLRTVLTIAWPSCELLWDHCIRRP